MSLPDAISSVFRQYVGFTGRARRSEFWWWVLFLFVVNLLTGVLDALFGTRIILSEDGAIAVFTTGVISNLVSLALFLPSLAVLIRRLHDSGRTGWWVLIGLIPFVGFIVLLVFALLDSEPGANSHGPNPKELPTGAAPA